MYQNLLFAELRAHPWGFATDREELAAEATAPAFGRANAFPLPSNCLRVLPPYPEQASPWRDWIVEGRSIYTNDGTPLGVRFTKNDPVLTDELFNQALACKIAFELCETLTQSNTKKAALKDDYKDAIREARRTNGIEKAPQESAVDDWVYVRNT